MMPDEVPHDILEDGSEQGEQSDVEEHHAARVGLQDVAQGDACRNRQGECPAVEPKVGM